MGTINILNDAGTAKLSLQFTGTTNKSLNSELLSSITSDVQTQLDLKANTSDVIDKAGDSGLNGYYTRTVRNVYRASDFGSGALTIASREIDDWKNIAVIDLSNPGSGGTQYIHLKTNFASTSDMMYFRLQGYSYAYGNTHTYIGLYMYSGTSILNVYTQNNGNSVSFYSCYKAADNNLVLIINLGATGYTSAAGRLAVQGQGYDSYKDLLITAAVKTSSSAAQY